MNLLKNSGTNIRETRILAGMIDDPELVSEKQMEEWAKKLAITGILLRKR